MDFDLTPEQTTLREEIVRFAQHELNDDLVRRDADSSFSVEAWKRCAAFGIQGLPIPAEYGGAGADALTIVIAMEALGYGSRDNGLIFSLNAQMWSCEIPIVRFGTEEQKHRYLPGLCDGSVIGVQCMTEPDTGSDAFNLTATAVRKDGRYVLNGAKTFITNAPDRGRLRRLRVDRQVQGLRRDLGLPRRPGHGRGLGGRSLPQDGTPDVADERGGLLRLRGREKTGCSDRRAPARRSSTIRWTGSGAASSRAPSDRCSASSSRASPTRRNDDSSDSRSASSRRSRIGSST